MKEKSFMFSNLPINGLVIPLLIVFFMQAALIMFYNSNNLTFPSLPVFHSLSRAAEIADANFLSFNSSVPSIKEANGFLYPAIVSVIYKIAGKYNLVPVIYVLSFFVFLFTAALFYKLACGLTGRETALAATAVFITAPPVALAMFSGGDVMIAGLLLALNAYFIFYHVQKGKYSGAWITAAALCLVNFSAMMFGAVGIAYLILKLNEKNAKKNYRAKMWMFFGVLTLVLTVLSIYVFGGAISASFMEQSAIMDTKTFQVDSFFKDGFLWSKVMPSFFAVLFYIAVFMGLSFELKSAKTGFALYAAAVTLAAVMMEIFSTFSAGADTVLFVSPFYLIMILYGIKGLSDVSGFIQRKNTAGVSAAGIFYAAVVLLIIVNMLFLFNKSVERNNVIKHISGNQYVDKFTER